jgi:hypothetical protein
VVLGYCIPNREKKKGLQVDGVEGREAGHWYSAFVTELFLKPILKMILCPTTRMIVMIVKGCPVSIGAKL